MLKIVMKNGDQLCRTSKVETQVVWGVARTSGQSSTKGDLGEIGEDILTSQSN